MIFIYNLLEMEKIKLLNKKTKNFIIISFLIVLSFANFYLCADEYGASFLELGAGARALSLGKASVASIDDAYAAYWNAAGLMSIDNMNINASFSDYFGLVSSKVFNYAHVYDKNVLGFTYIGSTIDGIPQTDYIDERPTVIGSSLFYSASLLMISYATDISYLFEEQPSYFGLSAKLIGEGFSGHAGASAFGLDMGLLHSLHQNIQLGFNLQNILKTDLEWDTPSKNKEKMPLVLRLGLATDFLTNTKFAFDINLQEKAKTTYHLGLEYKILKTKDYLVDLRLGLDDNRFTSGIGIKAFDFVVDYAYLPANNEDLGDSHIVSIGFSQ